MKFFQTASAAAALLGLAHAQAPTKVTILTPTQNSEVGVEGLGWMVDVVAEFSLPASATSAGAAAAQTSSSSSSSGGGSGYGYRHKRASSSSSKSLSFTPFLNSPNLTSFGPGVIDPAAPGFVCLLNTSSDPTVNLAGTFQLNAVTNSDASGDIMEAYLSWFVGAAAFGKNAGVKATVFFMNETAPAKYTGNPAKDPRVISNVDTVEFFVNGDAASNKTAPSTVKNPVAINVFTPRAGENVGRNGAGWMIDLVLVNSDAKANYFAPANGYKPLYHDNFTDPNFAPGKVSEAVPGLVVLSNTSTLTGGSKTNLANLFQINSVTGVKNGVITEYWCTWFVGAAFAGVNKASQLTIFVVNGTAPTTIDSMPKNLISEVTTVNFTIAGKPTKTGSAASTTSTGAASALSVGAGSLLFGALAFLF